MEKNKVVVKIAGRDFAISSYNSEAYVRDVAAWVDRRMRELHAATDLPGTQLAILTAVSAADDMMQSREEIRRLKKELAETRAALEARKA